MDLKEYLKVKEDYEVPTALMNTLLSDSSRVQLFEMFKKENFNCDFIRSYFETNQADRKNFMQDFTPDCIGEIVRGIVGKTDSVTDVCSGTGSLSVKVWKDNPNAFYRCEEYSTAALPFTLFNLAIRNITGYVIHENVLTKEIIARYYLKKGTSYSTITKKNIDVENEVTTVVTNPPYSQKWDEAENYSNDERFRSFGLPPKAKADFAFLLHGFYKLKKDGIMVAILPNGVLFRGQKEGVIRKKLIELGAIETVISLPKNLFANTSIPTILLVLRKERSNKDVYFIDAAELFEKQKNINNMTQEHVDKVLNAYFSRKNIEKFAYLAKYEEIVENEFNLNVSRYVDTFEAEPVKDIDEIMRDLRQYNHEERMAGMNLLDMMYELKGTTEEAERQIKEAVRDYELYMQERMKELPIEEKISKLHLSNPKWQNVIDIADVERAVKGKIYRAGSTLIPLSAVKEDCVPIYLQKDMEVDTRYAVISFRIPCIPGYMWNSVCSVFPRFAHKYAAGLNIQFDTLKYMQIPVHNITEQKLLQNEFDRQEEMERREAELVDKFISIKKTMLNMMFV